MLVAMVAHGPGPGVALFLTNMPVFFFFLILMDLFSVFLPLNTSLFSTGFQFIH